MHLNRAWTIVVLVIATWAFVWLGWSLWQTL